MRSLPGSPALALLVLALPAAGQADLIDVNLTIPATPADSDPTGFARLGGSIYFGAQFPGLGHELCAWDGATVTLVSDLRPGYLSSAPQHLVAIGGYIYFSAWADGANRELWRTDGTAAGTEFIFDLAPGPNQQGNPDDFTPLGSDVIFTGRTPTFGNGLWRTDGTPAGTLPLVSFSDGGSFQTADSPVELTPVGGLVFFKNYYGSGLWRTDGTVAGTFEVSPPSMSGVGNDLIALGSHLYFLASDWNDPEGALWRSDGTTVEKVASPLAGAPSYPTELALFAGELYFVARESAFERALYRSDGTPGNLTHLLNPAPGQGAYISNLTAAQTYLAFTVDQPSTGMEVWRSDGTGAGTQLIAEIVPGPGEFFLGEFNAVGDRVVFRAHDNSNDDVEPWATDGTQVYSLGNLSTAGPSDPAEYYLDGAELLFAATGDGVGREPWRTDGTLAGTQLAVDAAPTPLTANSSPRDFVRVGQKVFFTADDGVHGREVWVTDGTAAGTQLLVDANADPSSSEPTDLVALGDRLYFIATEQETPFTDKIEVWSSDGTPAGTAPLTDLLSIGFYYPEDLVSVGGHLYFNANDLNVWGWEPFSSDGTPGDLVSLGNLNPSTIAKDSDAEGFTAAAGTVFFRARDNFFNTRTWRTDGTLAGTQVVDVGSPTPALSPYEITPFGESLAIFRAFGNGVSTEPWVSDGNGTTLLADIAPGTVPSSPSGFTVLGDRVVFTAENAALGKELWVTDGTPAGTSVLFETVVGPSDGDPSIVGAVGGVALLRVRGSVTYDLWATDGTLAGTVPILDLGEELFAQGVGSAGVVAGDFYYFVVVPQFAQSEAWRTDGTAAGTVRLDTLADGFAVGYAVGVGSGDEILTRGEGAAGQELWRSRGTAASSVLVADIAAGAASSFPDDFIRVGDRVVFAAEQADTGRELYSLPFALSQGWVAEPFGVACPGTGGLAPRIGTSGAVQLGQTVEIEITGAFGPSNAFLYASFGSSAVPLAGCTVYVDNPLWQFGSTPTDPLGNGSVSVFLPPSLVGITNVPVYFQYAVIDPGGALLGVASLTDALEAIIGPAE